MDLCVTISSYLKGAKSNQFVAKEGLLQKRATEWSRCKKGTVGLWTDSKEGDEVIPFNLPFSKKMQGQTQRGKDLTQCLV